MPAERLQKILAAAGVASRRAAEELIAAGRVRVDGRPATLGQKVDPVVSSIEVDGVPVGVGAAHAYVALHKPGGVTSTTRDRHAATTVLDLVPTALMPDGARLYPVGRLDQDSEGLILLTNDGAWAERVLHPRFGVEREYAIGLGVSLTPEQASTLRAGILLEEGVARLAVPLRPATAIETRQLIATMEPPPDPGLAWYRATLTQGWKRQLRRMFGAIDAPIHRLVRVRIGIVRLGDLRSGGARNLKTPEVEGIGAGAPTERAASGRRDAPSRDASPRGAARHRGPGRRTEGW